ncbi:actin filament-associated protein 1-like 2 isoform X2 [Anomalospiza imberbis]|uniref:actin filament-associated protein 1-like 2 isoform X2 n=1 Tax=Anomalospiza imberbis TaxID=187417 RepID=UPI00358F2087
MTPTKTPNPPAMAEPVRSPRAPLPSAPAAPRALTPSRLPGGWRQRQQPLRVVRRGGRGGGGGGGDGPGPLPALAIGHQRRGEPPGRPEAQLCGFLWRKRWLGQWAKQLFIVREHVLLCFRCAADLQPVLELDLRGCRVTYKDKRGKKMPHALKVTGTAGEVLVIGFQSRQQAEDWRKVIEEVSSDAPSGLAALSVPASPSSRLSRLGKEEEEEGNRSRQSPARSPRPGEDAKGGFLAVRLRGRWQRLWCAVRHGALRMFPEPGAAQRPLCALRLDGCEVSPGAAARLPPKPPDPHRPARPGARPAAGPFGRGKGSLAEDPAGQGRSGAKEG